MILKEVSFSGYSLAQDNAGVYPVDAIELVDASSEFVVSADTVIVVDDPPHVAMLLPVETIAAYSTLASSNTCWFVIDHSSTSPLYSMVYTSLPVSVQGCDPVMISEIDPDVLIPFSFNE